MTQYWLVKSEPDAFSWDQQVANGVEPWTGVRNHMAKNNLKAMKRGDLAFFYHSNVGKEIVGVVKVVKEAYPDPSAESGDWVAVDMQAVGPMPRPVTLAEIKADAELADLALVRQSRLSVMPVSKPHWDRLCKLGGWSDPAIARSAAKNPGSAAKKQSRGTPGGNDPERTAPRH